MERMATAEASHNILFGSSLPAFFHLLVQFRRLGYEVVDWIADYYTQQLSTLPVKPKSIQVGTL
jgi:hypothetical protein